MVATQTVSQLQPSRKSPSKNGVLALSGFGVRVRVRSGHLEAEDGVGLERRDIRLARVGHGLKRLIMIGSDGFMTFEAMRWLADQNAAFVMLDRRGKVLAVTGPVSPTDAKLRRAQSLALGNGTALRISKELIAKKLAGQSALVRDMLHNLAHADAINQLRQELSRVESIGSVRLIEAQAAKLYWHAWSEIPICWPRKDERRVPEHWRQFGSRLSPLTHSPRLAANPPNTILNLLYSLTEAESRLAAAAMGLDPGIGLLHADTPNRDSLACDLQEPVRPSVDAFLLNWLKSEPLRKTDFFEDRSGNCRLTSTLAIKLCETAETWRRLVAPVVEYVAEKIWATIPRGEHTHARRSLATRLTQRNKCVVKQSEVPAVTLPKVDHHCRDCGVRIRRDKERCLKCGKQVARMNLSEGRRTAQQPEFLAQRAATMRAHRQQIANWKRSVVPVRLTREVYVGEILPALANIGNSQIRSALGVSEPYSSDIRTGKRIPHPRHWEKLAHLVGFSPNP